MVVPLWFTYEFAQRLNTIVYFAHIEFFYFFSETYVLQLTSYNELRQIVQEIYWWKLLVFRYLIALRSSRFVMVYIVVSYNTLYFTVLLELFCLPNILFWHFFFFCLMYLCSIMWGSQNVEVRLTFEVIVH